MRWSVRIAGTMIIGGLSLLWYSQPPQLPDVYILTAGTIVTMDPEQPEVEAVLIEGAVIKSVGSLADLMSQSNAPVIRRQGRTVIPGLVEPHTHPIASALLGAAVDIGGSRYASREGIMAALNGAADGMQLTPWIVAFGWDPIAIAGLHPPTLEELDAISPDKPLLVLTQMLHQAFINSAGLKAAGIALSHGAGLTELDLVNQAIAAIPVAPDAIIELLVRRQYQAYAKAGFTSIGIAGAVGRHPDPVGLLYRIGSGRDSSLRSFIYLLEDQEDVRRKQQSRISVVGRKYWLDGSPFTGGAATRDAYEVTPLTTETLGLSAGHRGEVLLQEDELYEKLRPHHLSGRQIALHVQGEQAIDVALTVLARLAREIPTPGLNHRLEHNALITKEQILRAGEIGVSLGFFVDHITYYGDQLQNIFGASRVDRYMPVANAQSAGVVVTLHGDHPATSLDPMQTLATAITRKSLNGMVVAADQSLSARQALAAMTLNAAKQLGQETQFGSIQIGKKADFTILDGNPLSTNPSDISNLQVKAVLIDGQPVDLRWIATLSPGLLWRLLKSQF
ncbi:amidohydrolase [Parasedimentitalea psychrophila]|uniref:Amidohydrolase family protein n=1 Tax=Parasedimentitalea psychrophila TaxID=2997337 RepID=A0A9Y2KXA7_9RHOB|nr:amidohydrolase family protein [Parasedimentitalea psychrophila]WIY24845.1 amidohydrolase family protein [Parasedimentitalea psychrophila]